MENLSFRERFEALTGLSIGGSKTDVEIGGIDNNVIKKISSGVPFIPGSSLKGKMRSLLKKALGKQKFVNAPKRTALFAIFSVQVLLPLKIQNPFQPVFMYEMQN